MCSSVGEATRSERRFLQTKLANAGRAVIEVAEAGPRRLDSDAENRQGLATVLYVRPLQSSRR